MTRTLLSIVALACLVFGGCRSFSSVFLHRNECNTGWEKEHLLHGVPITLKVPTHVRIDVIQTHFLIQSGSEIRRLPTPSPLLRVEHSFIESDKLFVVDFKRPAAGILNMAIDFDSEKQYFTKIDREYTDNTIAAVKDLLAAIAPSDWNGESTAMKSQSTFARGTGTFRIIREVPSVVASEIFEIDAPDFELQITAFLDRQLDPLAVGSLNALQSRKMRSPDASSPAVSPAPASSASPFAVVDQSQIELSTHVPSIE